MTNLGLQIENRIDDVTEALSAVEEFVEKQALPDALVMRVVVSLGEILSNVLSYGFEDDRPHRIDVFVEYARGEIAIEIIDDGKEFDPLSFPPPDLEADLDKRKIGGLGIHLVRNFMDRVRYARRDGRNHLSIAKALSAGD